MLYPEVDPQVRTYANGTLYSLLSQPFFQRESGGGEQAKYTFTKEISWGDLTGCEKYF